MEWRIEDTFKIINLYQQFPCLWDFQSPYYKRVDKKKNAWEEIAKNIEKDVDSVKKKIKNLRTAYLLEKKKVDSSKKKSGSSAEDLYTPHLFYYNEMSFLEPSVSLRETKSNLTFSNEEAEVIEFTPTLDAAEELSMDDTCLWSESDTPVSKKKNFKRAKRDDKINSALDAIIAKTTSGDKETMFTSFGKSVGMQLENLTLSSAMEAMAAIQKVITDIVHKKDLLETALLDANLI